MTFKRFRSLGTHPRHLQGRSAKQLARGAKMYLLWSSFVLFYWNILYIFKGSLMQTLLYILYLYILDRKTFWLRLKLKIWMFSRTPRTLLKIQNAQLFCFSSEFHEILNVGLCKHKEHITIIINHKKITKKIHIIKPIYFFFNLQNC